MRPRRPTARRQPSRLAADGSAPAGPSMRRTTKNTRKVGGVQRRSACGEGWTPAAPHRGRRYLRQRARRRRRSAEARAARRQLFGMMSTGIARQRPPNTCTWAVAFLARPVCNGLQALWPSQGGSACRRSAHSRHRLSARPRPAADKARARRRRRRGLARAARARPASNFRPTSPAATWSAPWRPQAQGIDAPGAARTAASAWTLGRLHPRTHGGYLRGALRAGDLSPLRSRSAGRGRRGIRASARPSDIS